MSPPQSHLLKAASCDQFHGSIDPRHRSFVRRSACRPIERVQDLVGFGQTHHQGSIPPLSLVVEIHPFLATPRGLGRRAVHVDRGSLAHLRCLALPHLQTAFVEGFLKGQYILLLETPQKVPFRTRCRDLARSYTLQIADILAPRLYILKAHSPTHHVVDQIQDVVRLPVGKVPLQHSHTFVDPLRHLQALDQLNDQPQTSTTHPSHTPGDVVDNIASSQHPSPTLRPPTSIQPSL